MALLESTTLIVCGLVLLLRVPAAIQGRNRMVFGILVLATVCSLLSVAGAYEAIDRVLGGWNVTHLILRYLVFTVILLAGLRITTGLSAARGHRLIAGPAGRWALGLSCLAVAVTFFLMDTRGSSARLVALAGNGHNTELLRYYAAAGYTYPAFVSLVLMPPLLATARSRLPRLFRAGALLMFVGALCAALSLPASLAPEEWDTGARVINYAAVLGYVLGVAMFWFSGPLSRASGWSRGQPHRNTLRRNSG